MEKPIENKANCTCGCKSEGGCRCNPCTWKNCGC